jgi:glycosyltransferase involved in cell wall biosynthesis
MSHTRQKDLVSIVIPCYNSAKFIGYTLDSIIQQTYSNIEVIIVNDGSTDQSAKVINYWIMKNHSHFLLKNKRLTVLTLPYNVGYAGANTIGLFLARGEYIAMNDADDISHKMRIEKQVAFLKNNPIFDMVGTYVAWFKGDNPEKNVKFNFIKDGYYTIKHSYVHAEKSASSFGSLLFRGIVFDKIGGLVNTLPGTRTITGHDFLFIKKCLMEGFKLHNIPEILYFYRRHANQMSKGT